jgi:hypothetical protein
MLSIELVNVSCALIGLAPFDLNVDEPSGVRPTARKSQYGIYANVAFQEAYSKGFFLREMK